ncbi:transcriptional regulator [Escherichia phage vB_EcoM_ESCO47]|nr:transcriptional regulator [Escherichia phage vB_EcoM_ESCO47]
MLVYRVERSFCTQREYLPSVGYENGEMVRTWEISWNKEPRSPYGWSGTDNSEETWEFLDKHGILSGNFYHNDGNINAPNRPTIKNDHLLSKNILKQNNLDFIDQIADWLETGEFYFAFDTVDTVYRWFDNSDDIELLKAKGYYIAVYDAPDVILGDSQLLFKRSSAEQVDFILIK